MQTSSTQENYLKAIYHLSGENAVVVSTNELAEKLQTSAATVTDMLKKLSDQKLLHYKPYKGVVLSSAGKKTALMVIRNHRLWEFFLVNTLQMGWEQVHEIAEQLEHIQSPLLIKKLDAFLQFPRFDPHGDPIPDENGRMHASKGRPLPDCESGKNLLFNGVADHSEAFLLHLNKLGLYMGCGLKILRTEAYDKSMEVLVGKKKKVTLSHQSAANILTRELNA